MRTLTTATAILAVGAALFGSMLVAEAKGGPFRVEVCGGDLAEPVIIEGPVTPETVFFNDGFAVRPPRSMEPAYTVKLTPAQPSSETGEDFVLTLTYFPGEGDGPALLRGEWDSGDRYFQASPEFELILNDAIGGVRSTSTADNDDGVSAVWYIAPSLAAVGLMLIGGLAGRRLLFRHDE